MAKGKPIWYAQAVDNSGLRKGQAEAKTIWKQMEGDAERTGLRTEKVWNRAGHAIGGALSVAGLTAFTRKMVQIRGEFQQLEISFETMLKSGEKATKLMSGLTEFAATTPFGLQSAASGAKQLLAYGSVAETVIDELRMLGDVAAGTGQSINDIVYLYGTLRTQGRAYMMDIRQFAGRGIPIYDELAKVLGVTKDQVNEFVSAGKVGFAEIEQAFKNMTSASGLYGGLMEKQSVSVTGRIEQLNDAIDIMFNNIGKANEGIVYSAISGAASLVENYEKVGKIIASLIATYGAYRAAVIVTNVVLKEQAAINGMVAASNGIFNKSLAAQFLWTERIQKVQAALNKTMLANPYVAAVAAIAALVAIMWNFSDASNSVAEAQKRVINATKDFEKAAASEQARIDILFGKLKGLKDGTDEYKKAKQDIIDGYGNYLRGLGDEIEALNDIEGAYKAVSTAALQSARDRALATGIQNATDAFGETYADQIGKLRKKLISKFGELAGEQMLQEIRTALDSGEVKLGQDVSKLLQRVVIEGGNVTNNIQRNDIQREMGRLVDNVRIARYALEKETEELHSILKGVLSVSEGDAGGGENTVENLTKISTIISDIQSKSNELASLQLQTSWTDEEKKKITTLSEELDGLKKQYQELTGNQWDKRNDSSAKATQEVNKEILVQYQKLYDEETALKRKQITDKQALIQFDLQETIKAINKEREEYEKSLREYGFSGNIDTSVFDNRIAAAQKEAAFSTREFFRELMAEDEKFFEESISSLNDYYKEYGTYEEKRLAITQDYAKKIAEAQTTGEAAILQKEQEKALQELEMSLIKQSDLWTRLFGDASKQTTKYIQETIAQTEQLLDYLNGVEGSELPLGFTEESIRALGLDAEQVKSILEALTRSRDEVNRRNPFGNLIRGFKDLKEARDRLNAARDTEDVEAESDALNDQYGALGRIVGAAGEAAQVIGQLSNALQGLGGDAGEALGKVSDVLGQTASMASTGLQVGGVAGGVVGGVIGLTTSLAKVFGGAKELSEETIRSYNSYTEAIDRVVSKQKELLTSLSGVNATTLADETAKMLQDQIDATIKIGQDYLNSGSGLFSSSHGKKLAKSLSPYRKELAAIGIDLDKLGGRAEGIFSLDSEQLTELSESASLWSVVDDRTQEYITNILNSQGALEELNKSLSESRTATTFDALKNGLDDLVTQADLAFGDIQESFEDHMSKAILNVVKNKVLNSQLEAWYEQFAQDMKDGALSSDEANRLQAEYERIIKEANEAYKLAMNTAGISLGDIAEEQRTSVAKGIATASQDSVDKMEGTLTNIQSHTYSINETLKIMHANSAVMLDNVVAIRENTNRLAAMDDNLRIMRSDINDISNRGLVMRKE